MKVVTPAATEPDGVAPDAGVVEDVLYYMSYPFAGGEAGAVQPTVAEFAVIEDIVSEVGSTQVGVGCNLKSSNPRS